MSSTESTEQIYASHLIDDFERLRGKAIRSFMYLKDTLNDAPHAVNNGAPHVAVEKIEFAIGELNKQLAIFRAKRPTGKDEW